MIKEARIGNRDNTDARGACKRCGSVERKRIEVPSRITTDNEGLMFCSQENINTVQCAECSLILYDVTKYFLEDMRLAALDKIVL